MGRDGCAYHDETRFIELLWQSDVPRIDSKLEAIFSARGKLAEAWRARQNTHMYTHTHTHTLSLTHTLTLPFLFLCVSAPHPTHPPPR